MDSDRVWARSSLFVAGFGGLLFTVAVVHHATEAQRLGEVVGPLTAFVLDGLPALGLVALGYWLSKQSLLPEGRRLVVLWSLAGSLLFVVVLGATLLVRSVEGRPIGEPLFPLLVGAEAGAIAGSLAGYYNARSRQDAARAEAVNDALTFVNHLIRHDLRNDLTVVRAHGNILVEEGENPESAAVIVDKAGEALDRIETTRAIVATLTGEAEYESIDIRDICTELAEQIADSFSVEVETDLPDEPVVVAANEGIRPVVDNLLENAAEHNDSEQPKIHITAETHGDVVRIVISDNGPGIPDDQKARLFESRSDSLSGGGLSLIQTLVTRYGGSVTVQDNEPSGSRFVVELPRGDAERAQ